MDLQTVAINRPSAPIRIEAMQTEACWWCSHADNVLVAIYISKAFMMLTGPLFPYNKFDSSYLTQTTYESRLWRDCRLAGEGLVRVSSSWEGLLRFVEPEYTKSTKCLKQTLDEEDCRGRVKLICKMRFEWKWLMLCPFVFWSLRWEVIHMRP